MNERTIIERNQVPTAEEMLFRAEKGHSTPLPGRRKFTPDSGKHIQIGAGKHGVQAVLILPEPAVHSLRIFKLTFDDPEDMLYLAAYGGFEVLNMS